PPPVPAPPTPPPPPAQVLPPRPRVQHPRRGRPAPDEGGAGAVRLAGAEAAPAGQEGGEPAAGPARGPRRARAAAHHLPVPARRLPPAEEGRGDRSRPAVAAAAAREDRGSRIEDRGSKIAEGVFRSAIRDPRSSAVEPAGPG